MLKIGVVGDLSGADPTRYQTALDAALAAADYVVSVGDIYPGYDVLKARLGRVFPIPGNHDVQGPGHWEVSLPGVPKQWRRDYQGATLIGLDNSCDRFDDEAWGLLNSWQSRPGQSLFVFVHKSLSALVLPNGIESQHIMGEGSLPCADALKVQTWLASRDEATLVCGHYHGWTMMHTSYGTVILEGRGGAAAEIGYTLIFIQPEGWTAHPVVVA